MTECQFCDREMLETASCTKNAIEIDGELYEPIAYGDEKDWPTTDRCHDCGVEPGGFHHPGCDVERDPATSEQLLMRVISSEPKNAPRHARVEHDPHVQISADEIGGDPDD